MNVTGDATGGVNKSEKAIVTAIPFPVVLKADLDDATHPINNRNISGKRAGACVICNNAGAYSLVMALGPAATDVWHLCVNPAAAAQLFTTPA